MSALLAWGQQTVVTERFTTSNGLSNNSVLCALRDSYGLLWVGTENGLNCFDGQRIRVYRDMVASENPDETNTIMSLYEFDGDIWFGGTVGLYVFSRYDNAYRRFMKQTQYGVCIASAVPKIVRHDRLIWIITMGQGIFTYNTENGTLSQDSRHGSFFSDIIVGNDGLIYAVTLSGQLVVFRSDGQFLRSYDVDGYEIDKNPISIAQTGGELWLAYGTQLQRLNQTARTTELQMKTQQLGAIHAITTDSEGRLLLGCDKGLYQYSPPSFPQPSAKEHLPGEDSRLKRINDTSDANHMTDMIVNGLMWDTDSTLLVLTRAGGLNGITIQQQGFNFIPLPNDSENRSEHNFIHALCYGTEGDLWIGTSHGLFRTHSPEQQMVRENKVPSYEIKALMLDGNDLWIGTRNNGLYVMNLLTGTVSTHTYSDTQLYTIPSNEVNGLYRTSQGDIYVLTSWGLSRYDRPTGYFRGYANISAMTSFICIQEAAGGWVWASSTGRGLLCKRTPNGMFEAFRSATIGRQTVTTMLANRQGELWAATDGGGLYRYDEQKSDFVRLDSSNTILNNLTISFIEEDDQGGLWLGTQTGIMRISPSRDPKDLQVYNVLHPTDFHQLQHSPSVSRQGMIIFGGDGGIFCISTNEMTPSTQQQKVYIQELSLPYAADSPQELQRIGLDILLYTREHISLPYADNSFTLHFSSAHYSGMPETKYEYMLQGFDRTWAHGTTLPEATYANLPPGDYEFLLRPMGQTDKESTAHLQITILPPWYLSFWAYLAYSLLIATAVVGVYYLTQRRLKRSYQRQMHDFQQQQEKETFQSKIRFFVDLVHEIRTPLTLMSLPIEAINEKLKNGDPSLEKHITAIQRNMNYLLGITNQLLDFQKQENGGITLVRRKTDLGQMLSQIYDQFSDAAEVQGKRFQLQLPDESVELSIDRDKITKVMMNLVGNAMKYAKSEIIMRLTASEQVAISIIDDGIGIPPESREKIFDRYYQIGGDNIAASIGTGLGLAYAKMLADAHGGNISYSDAPGGGSCFTLVIPNSIPDLRSPRRLSQRKEGLDDSPSIVSPSNDSSNHTTLHAGRAGGGYRVLLVEDNEELLSATAESLRQWYKVVKGRNGIEALDLLKYHDIDIIISDVMMPHMDGVELCRRLKQNVETSHLPVILLTAKVSVDAKTEGMEGGADVYLEKPFSIRQLHLQIESLLRLRQQFYERMRSLDDFTTANDSIGKPAAFNQQDLQFIEALQKSVADNMRDEEFSIDTLAEQLNMSRSSFYRKIKALTGMTPTDYLKTARMNQAAHLLRQGLRSSEVAERVGFTSSSYFAKCFRAQFGCLPKDYV